MMDPALSARHQQRIDVLVKRLHQTERERDEAVAAKEALLVEEQERAAEMVAMLKLAHSQREEIDTLHARVGARIDECDTLRALLRECEWPWTGECYQCQVCGAFRETEGDTHAPDCKLKAALEGA